MNELEVRELISKGEGHHLEYKEKEEYRDFAKVICAFANTDGGKILIGVDDSGQIVGIQDTDKTMLRLDDIAYHRCSPPITMVQEVISIEEKQLIVVSVPKGNQRPYMTNGKCYIRSSNRTREATREELLRLFQKNESIFYDELPVSQATLGDLDSSKLYDFFEQTIEIHVTNNDINNYLKNFSLITSDENPTPTVAGLLFFAKNPQRYLKEARIVCCYIPGNDIALEPADVKSITGTIDEMITDTQRYFKLYLRESHRIKDFEPELYPELPLTPLREFVVNAFAHRDYTISSPIRLIIFTDRIEIHSPGSLPNTVTVDKIRVGGSHVLRNPTIYNLLNKYHYVTDLGSGVRRACETVQKALHKDVELHATEGEFIVSVPRASIR